MITRRDIFIAGASATLGAAASFAITGSDCWRTRVHDNEFFPAEKIVASGLGAQMDALLVGLKTSRSLGEKWLQSLAQMPDAKILGQDVYGRLQNINDDLAKAANTQIKSDYKNKNLCQVDGWNVSMTECKLAGLYVLLHPETSERVSDAVVSEVQQRGQIAELANWGPQTTNQGQKFNVQVDGHSGLWFQFNHAPPHAKIMIDGEIAPTVISEEVVTSGLFGAMQDRILNKPGQYAIKLVDPIRGIEQDIGFFTVVEDSRLAKERGERDSVFCTVKEWGPQQTQAGVAANPQPDGAMGLWIKTDCFPDGARIMFGDDPLTVTRREFGATSSIPLPLLEAPGRKPLTFFDPVTQERVLWGHLSIE